VREALPEIEGQGFLEILDRVYETGEPFVGKEMPVLLQKEPGHAMERCFVDLVYMPTRDAEGKITGIFAHGNDITDRKLAEQSLELQARTFDILLSAIEDYVFIFDREHRFTYANRVLLDLWGLPAGQALPMSMAELQYAPEVQQNLDASIEEVFRTGDVVRNEVAYTNPAGASGHFEYILAPVRDASGAVESVAGTSRDISGRKKAAEERERLLESERVARTEAERASQMKDEFLATLSHELRTPLNAILGWSTLLRSDATPADIAEGVEVIERNARSQARIIDDLLDMSRIISGKVRLDVQRVELAAVLEAAMETVKPAADAKGVRLHAILDQLAQPVNGDPGRLQQVFWNLLTNAVKFTPRGGRVRVLLERVNSHLEACVIDTGEGIAPEFLPHVFDRFRQADGTTRRSHGGLGLGLAIVKQLVELHGGSVTAKSGGLGQGSTFTVTLPLSVLHPSTADEPERRHPRSTDPTPHDLVSSLDLSGVNILVVDDEPDARALLARLLTGCNAIVRTAAFADEAFALVRAEIPDVLISDIGMPGEDGYSLIRRVRALAASEGGNVPALALTAYARAEDRMKAVLAGFQMHVAKPVEGAELLAMVASLAGRAGQPG
jgi:PAS domain S-box-containing protein